jgi:hypothetical protein
MWGVGTVLYTMLMGEPPFAQDSYDHLSCKLTGFIGFQNFSKKYKMLNMIGAVRSGWA